MFFLRQKVELTGTARERHGNRVITIAHIETVHKKNLSPEAIFSGKKGAQAFQPVSNALCGNGFQPLGSAAKGSNAFGVRRLAAAFATGAGPRWRLICHPQGRAPAVKAAASRRTPYCIALAVGRSRPYPTAPDRTPPPHPHTLCTGGRNRLCRPQATRHRLLITDH